MWLLPVQVTFSDCPKIQYTNGECGQSHKCDCKHLVIWKVGTLMYLILCVQKLIWGHQHSHDHIHQSLDICIGVVHIEKRSVQMTSMCSKTACIVALPPSPALCICVERVYCFYLAPQYTSEVGTPLHFYTRWLWANAYMILVWITRAGPRNEASTAPQSLSTYFPAFACTTREWIFQLRSIQSHNPPTPTYSLKCCSSDTGLPPQKLALRSGQLGVVNNPCDILFSEPYLFPKTDF